MRAPSGRILARLLRIVRLQWGTGGSATLAFHSQPSVPSFTRTTGGRGPNRIPAVAICLVFKEVVPSRKRKDLSARA